MCETADEKIIASIIAVPTFLRGDLRRDLRVSLDSAFIFSFITFIFNHQSLPCVPLNINFLRDDTINKSYLS